MDLATIRTEIAKHLPPRAAPPLIIRGAEKWLPPEPAESYTLDELAALFLPDEDGEVMLGDSIRLHLFGANSIKALNAQREPMFAWLFDAGFLPFAMQTTGSVYCMHVKSEGLPVCYFYFPDWVEGEASGQCPWKAAVMEEGKSYPGYITELLGRAAAGIM